MGFREVNGLRWAKLLEERPSFIPKGRPRGQKTYGIRYEKAIEGKIRGVALRGQWWEFEDRNGPGVCQTDFWWPDGNLAVVLESKYTWTAVGHMQIDRLYRPVVEMATGLRVIGAVVCRNLVQGMQVGIYPSLEEALQVAPSGAWSVWHFLG